MINLICLILFFATPTNNIEIKVASETIDMADSLSHIHQLYTDTDRLFQAERIFLQNKKSYRKELAKTYYYLGHINDHLHHYEKEVDYFILCLETYNKDNQIKGQIYMHFESISRNCGDLQMATLFGEMCVKFLSHDKDPYWYPAALYNLYNLYSYQNLTQKAEDIFEKFMKCEKDEISHNLYQHMLATKLYNEKLYTEVIEIMNDIIDTTNNINHYLTNTYIFTLANSYKQLGNNQEAIKQYLKILNSSCNFSIKTMSYDSIRSIASTELIHSITDVELLELKENNKHFQDEIKASQILRGQLEKTERNKKNIYILLFILIICIISISIITYLKKSHKTSYRNILNELLTAKEYVNQTKDNQIKKLEETIKKHQKELQSNITNGIFRDNYTKEFIDADFNNLATKLEKVKNINITEIKFCYLCLLNCTYIECANILYRSPETIGSLKKRIAKKLGTTSANLKDFLIKMVLE